jgi:hypothetical protein
MLRRYYSYIHSIYITTCIKEATQRKGLLYTYTCIPTKKPQRNIIITFQAHTIMQVSNLRSESCDVIKIRTQSFHLNGSDTSVMSCHPS